MPERAAYRTREVAEMLDVSEDWVLLRIQRGEIEGVRLGRLWFVPAHVLEALLGLPPAAASAACRRQRNPPEV